LAHVLTLQVQIGSPDTLDIFIERPKPKRVNSFNLNFIDESQKSRLQIEGKNHLQARAQLEEDLRGSEKDNGLSDSKTLRIVANLASNYAQLGDFAAAGLAYQRLLMATEQKEGRWHPTLMPILTDMASACQQQGNYGEAEKYMGHLLKIQDQLLTSEAPASVRAAAAKNLATFAILLDLQGKFAESESQHIKIVQMRESSLGHTADETLKAVENLGHNYRNQKKYPRAISTYQDALERRLKGPERSLSQITSTASKLAEVFEKIGKRAEAEKIRAYWRRRAALRGCWPDPESNLDHELQPITPKTKFGTQKRCWATSKTGSAFEKFRDVCPLLKEVLHSDAELKKGRKAVAPKVSYTCCMVGFSPDAVRPAVVLHCQQMEISCAAEAHLESTTGWKDWSEANPMFLLLIAESALKKLRDSPETP
jgi:tetratricopeptide (TPR) repeat protein